MAATLSDLCDLKIDPTPCSGPQERRNWMEVFRLKELLCELLGENDGDELLNLTRFRLTANLDPGGSAAAVKLSYPGGTATEGDAITVNDVDPSEPWRGLIGYEGWAAQREGNSTEYNILIMERIARRVRGTLAGDLSGGSASANVSEFDDGKDPGATVTVHDPNSHFPQALSGATYEAVYNVKLARYEVLNVQVTEWAATATAGENFGPSDSVVSLSSVTFKTYPDQDDDPPTPATALNVFGLTGFAGDSMHIQRRWPDGEWEILVPDKRQGQGGQQPRVVFFKLTAQLNIGGSTTAVILERSGGAFVETTAIQVFDPYDDFGGRGMWSGISGFRGKAKQREDDPTHFDIIWMEQYAREIHFQLTENMGATTSQEATATVLYAWGQGVSPGATVTVHDDGNTFKYALAGAWGTATRNEYLDTSRPDRPYYTIRICDQMAMHGGAQLSDNVCGAGNAGVTQFQGWSIFPHGQTPPLGTVNTAANPFALSGTSSDPVLLMFRDKSMGSGGKDYEYVWAQAKHKEIAVEVEDFYEDGCWKYVTRKIWSLFCNEDETEANQVCGEDC